MAGTLAHLTQALVAYGNHVPVTDLCPTVVPEAAQLVTSDPYAFCMAACLDRGAQVRNYLDHPLRHSYSRRSFGPPAGCMPSPCGVGPL
jgi:hypothetical protein